jgi:O-Antigen ligase
MTQVPPVVLAVGLASVLGLGLVTIRRPALGCALLAAAIPLTGGMSRGSVVPLLRVNEALLLVVVGGFLVHELPRKRALPFTALDLIVLAYCLGGTLIPWAVLVLTHVDADLDTWRTVVAPIQYLLVYVLFSRVSFSPADLRLVLQLAFLASVVVALVALGELANFPGVRQFVAAYYPPPLVSGDNLARPTSLLGHFSAVAAFALLNFLLALALTATRHPGFSSLWLGVVMALQAAAILATQTLAPLLALPVAAAIVVLYTRRFPWQLAFGPVAVAGAALAFWPYVQGRIQQQLSGGGTLGRPETLQTRITYWQDFFLPALFRHEAWLGTGTVIPSEVPGPLVSFVDNGYLFMAFRAGVPGVTLIVALLVAIAVGGWRLRSSRRPWPTALGATCVAAVGAVALLEITSEYLTFTSVTQEFWMLVGLLGGTLVARSAARQPTMALSTIPSRRESIVGLQARRRGVGHAEL